MELLRSPIGKGTSVAGINIACNNSCGVNV